jgi:hypothetical protein
MGDDVISIMISSRNTASIKLGRRRSTLSALRRKLKAKIEGFQPFGQPLFSVWINEDEAEDASADTWQHSLDRVRSADLVLVLYNGDPGWAWNSTIGICHAEVQAARNGQAGKVFAIALSPLADLPTKKADRERHQMFRKYWVDQGIWAVEASSGDEVLERIDSVLHEAVTSMVQLGVLQTHKGRFDTGDALGWSRLNFASRKQQIEESMRKAIRVGENARELDSRILKLKTDWADIYLCIHAVPGAMGVAAAREMVGRPFHHDHRFATHLDGRQAAGPVQVIGCHRGITELQAMTLLGRPDVTTVSAEFGVLAVDQVSKVQCLLIRDCRDEGTTRDGVGTTFRWLRNSGEWRLLVERARSRARIVTAIARELS